MTHDLPDPSRPLKIGTRGSPLALAQAYETRSRLMAAFDLSEEAFEIVVIKTTGDNRAMIEADRPLKEIGGKGLFTREIEEAMLAGGIDIAVHSMKDMPVEQPAGLVLDTYLPREDVRDAFVSPGASRGWRICPKGPRWAPRHCAARRRCLSPIPHLQVVEFQREMFRPALKKLDDGVATCTFLAMAGLNRLDRSDVIALCHRTRRNASRSGARVPSGLNGARTMIRMSPKCCRRSMTRKPARGWPPNAPFWPRWTGPAKHRSPDWRSWRAAHCGCGARFCGPDGSESLKDEASGPVEDGAQLGQEMAKRLLEQAGPNFFDWRH